MSYLLPKTRKEIAQEYGISTKTLYRWLTKHEIDLPSGLILPKHQISIYQKLGYPKSYYLDNLTERIDNNYSTGKQSDKLI